MTYRDPFYQAIRGIVERRGEKAKQLWTVASGFNPMVPPATALANLKNMVSVVRTDLQDEAKALIRDLDNLFQGVKSQADTTIRTATLPGIGKITEMSTRLPGGGRITGIFG